jgi:hypothetical protein
MGSGWQFVKTVTLCVVHSAISSVVIQLIYILNKQKLVVAISHADFQCQTLVVLVLEIPMNGLHKNPVLVKFKQIDE